MKTSFLHLTAAFSTFFRRSFYWGCCCALLATWYCPAVFSQPSTAAGSIQVAITPTSHGQIFAKVAVLPFRQMNNQVNQELTAVFFQELDQTKKYRLVTPPISDRKTPSTLGKDPQTSMQQGAIAWGRAAGIRGVIAGIITEDQQSRQFEKQGAQSATTKIFISMMDIQHAQPVWTLTLSLPVPTGERSPGREEMRSLLQQGVAELLVQLVQQGDIFTTQLPAPQVLSTQREPGRVQIMVQPEAPTIFTAYQLLRAGSPDAVFTPVGRPKANSRSPLVLEDTDLHDNAAYYYTLIGISSTGLANVPAPPFAVTRPEGAR